MQRLLCLLLALTLLPAAVPGQSKKRRPTSGRSKAASALPTVLNRKTALRMLQSVVPSLYDGTRYKSGRFNAPFTQYGTTPAKLRERNKWVRAAELVGWITLSEGRSTDPYSPGATTVVRFTAEGARLFDGSTPGYSCDKWAALNRCQFRAAELQAQSVTAIRQTSATEAEVLYVWAYEPLPGLREAGVAPEAWSAAATFARYDDGWRIVRLGL